jgi:hypothetical protein
MTKLSPRPLNRKQIFRAPRQNLAAGFRDHNRILDAHSPFTRHIYARLNSDDHSRPEQLLLPNGHPRPFVNFEAQPMPGRVRKVSI